MMIITSACPTCHVVAEREAYDIGSGPELSCANCEWCWGAEGQDLQPLDIAQIATDRFREAKAEHEADDGQRT